MYLPFPIGYGYNGLGAVEAEEGCDQPVDPKVRDEILWDLKMIVGGHFSDKPPSQHLHEGHPDIKAFLADIIPRMDGLKNRPKLLRCNQNARDKAAKWIANHRYLEANVKRKMPNEPGGVPGSMTVIPAGGFDAPVFNSKTHHIRGPWFNGKFQPIPEWAENWKPGDTATKTEAVTTGGAPTAAILPPEVQGVWNALTTGEIFGVPKAYLVYGALGLLAYRFFFSRR